MSTALQRSIQRALADFGRPTADDATLTTGVNELIAALSESEQDAVVRAKQRSAAYADRDSALDDLAAVTQERDTALADAADLRTTVDGLLTERTTLIATANRRLYDAKGIAFFSGVAVATIVEAVIRMAQ